MVVVCGDGGARMAVKCESEWCAAAASRRAREWSDVRGVVCALTPLLL